MTHSVPVMTYSDPTVHVQYTGTYKIAAIKTLRSIFGLELRAAKDLVEWRGGFIVNRMVMDLLNAEYGRNVQSYADTANCGMFETMSILPPAINMARIG